MKKKKEKYSSMTRKKYYKKMGWKVSQLTEKEKCMKGYRVRYFTKNGIPATHWISTFEYRKLRSKK